jgi:hypothetical protein
VNDGAKEAQIAFLTEELTRIQQENDYLKTE